MNSFSFKNLIVLLFVVGFPRVPFTDVPLALLIAPFYFLDFLNFSLKLKGRVLAFLGIVAAALLYGFLVSILNGANYDDIYFHVAIWGKLLLSVYFGYVVFFAIKRDARVLGVWIIVQCLIIGATAVSLELYGFMLAFISPRSADVFSNIFGLRALGLGLYHVDGAMALTIASFVFFYLSLNNGNAKWRMPVLTLPFSLMMARSAIVPFTLLFLVMYKMRSLFWLVTLLIILGVLSLQVDSGPLSQALELFNSVIVGDGVMINSIVYLIDMYVFPDNFKTFLIGDGLYFVKGNDLTFYMGTDVGYLRLLFFWGIFGVLIFIFANCYLVQRIVKYSCIPQGARLLLTAMIFIFLMINFKGIQVMPLLAFSFAFYFYDKQLQM